MQQRPSSTCLLFTLMLSLLAACSSVGQLAAPPEAEAAPPQQQGRGTPAETVRSFLEAWNEQNIEAMYDLVSPRSAEIFSFEDFAAEYTTVHDNIGFDGVDFTIEEVTLQGQTAAVAYDATLHSNTFGSIVDAGRLMRLLHEGSSWQIAWTPMDIMNGMTSQVRLQPQRRFPPRANIYDRNELPLADENGTVIGLRLRKLDMSNEADCISLLAQVMLRRRSQVAQLFVGWAPETVFYVGEMDPEIFAANRAELNNSCGVDVEVPGFSKVIQSTGRNYYGHGAATHITGYIGRVPGSQLEIWRSRGYRDTDIVGLAGVEGAYEETLAGTPEQFLRLIEPAGTTIRELGSATGSNPTPIMLTIDRDLQYQTAQAINDAFNFAQINWASVASGAAAIVMDVTTGEILAMASYPTFDPRIFNPDSTYVTAQDEINTAVSDPRSPLSNKVVAEQYAPGSTFKIITTVAAAQSDVWQPGQIFDCTLTWEGAKFGDVLALREDWRVVFEREAAGELTMFQALATSCNPFFWEVGGLMYQQNRNTLANFAQMFGLGQTTGLADDLSVNEATGRIPVPGSATEALNNAIGQGDTQITVVQLVRAVAAIANGGTLYQPYIVKQIGGLDAAPLQDEFEPLVLSQLELSTTVFDVVQRGMCAVTTDEEFGTAYEIFETAPYTSCGKTGSAQAGTAESGVAPHSWYVSYAPRENPEIAVAVVVPTSREGSDVAAPIVRRILDNYFGVAWEPYPEWWEGEYVPVDPPRGVAGTG